MILAEQLQHPRQQTLVVLQISVHHGHVARLTRQRAFYAGAGKSAAPHAPNTTHASVDLAQPFGDGRCGIGKSSSTKMISQSTSANAAATRSMMIGTLADSLNVGMTTVSSGAGRSGMVAEWARALPAGQSFATFGTRAKSLAFFVRIGNHGWVLHRRPLAYQEMRVGDEA